LLAGCVTQPVLTGPQRQARWDQRQQVLQGIDQWDLHGRIALRAGDHGWQASLRWKKSGVDQSLALNGPIGTHSVLLEQDANGARLRDSQGRDLRDSNAGLLLQRVTGWRIPVASLNYWVRGLPAPGGQEQVQLDGRGRLAILQQQQWTVRFLRYGEFDGMQLPQKIDMTHRPENGSASDLSLRLVVDAWNAGA
jgi:outer membrane lipoprotein LolB